MPPSDRAATSPSGEAPTPRWSVLLRALRESSGVTQDGWAARLGYSRSTVQRWERGESVPDAAAAEALIGVCTERRLFRTFNRGPLAGLTLTPELLHDLLAQARSGEAATPPLPPTMARLFDRLRRRFADADDETAPSVPQQARPTAPAAISPFRPPSPTTFIGREREAEEVLTLLEGARLLTLIGPGGIGKTRLAVHIAEAPAPRARDGVWIVRLAPLADAALIPAVVAAAIGVREEPGRPPAETLTAALAPKDGLLVLDNCEHLLEAIAGLADELLRACPSFRILATSRTPLRLAAETVYRVPPLSVPGSWFLVPGSDARGQETGSRNQELERADAVRLFAERARVVMPTFRLAEGNSAVIAHICRALDGIPLAIELAAARMRILTPEQIAARLDGRLRLLGGGDPAEPRHETLSAALDWSHELLTEPEQVLLRRLSVFAGGCEIEAVEAVCTGDGVNRNAVFDLVTHLADKSLLVVEHGGVVARYRLLETTRQYAAERLDAAGEGETVRARLCGWAVALGDVAAERLTGPEQAAWLTRLDAEHDTLRAVLAWTLDRGREALGVQLAAALWRFWQMRGHLTEGRAWFNRLLARAERVPSSVRAGALLGAGTLAQEQGDFQGAVPLVEESLTLARELGEEAIEADALLMLSGLAWRRSEYGSAAMRCEECLAIARARDDRRLAARSLNLLGALELDQGEYADAHIRFVDGLAAAREAGDPRTSALLLNNLGLTAQRQEQPERALVYLEDALAINRGLGNTTEIGRNLMMLALVAMNMGELDAALERAEAALAIARETANRNGIAEALSQLSQISRRRGDWVAARTYSMEHLQTARAVRDPMLMLAAVWEAAAIARTTDSPRRAVRLIAASEAQRLAMGIAQGPAMQRSLAEHCASLRARLGEPAYSAAWAEGASLSLDRAIEHALADTEG